MGAANHFRYWPRWAAAASLVTGLFALLTVGASGGGIALTNVPQALPAHGVTISGLVRSTPGAQAIDNRLVEIVDVLSGERHSVTTDRGGAFSLKVKPGTYRLQVLLLSGETLIEGPRLVRAGPEAADLQTELVITTVRLSRPRAPVYQPSSGLGAPVV